MAPVGLAPAAVARGNALPAAELTMTALDGVCRSPVSRLFTLEGSPIRRPRTPLQRGRSASRAFPGPHADTREAEVARPTTRHLPSTICGSKDG
jgi:hypothetical protein